MAPGGPDLAWDAEEACANAWPSPRQAVVGGWLLRASGGPTRRVNSVNPLRGGPTDPTAILPFAEDFYARQGRDPVFRVPTLVPAMDAPLARRGYVAEAETVTLYAGLAGRAIASPGPVPAAPDAAWLAARRAFAGADDAAMASFRATVDAIALPRAFVSQTVDGQVAAIAYGVLSGGLLVIEAVATDPAQRQRGHARRAVGRLLDWARTQGVDAACLQVMADNPPALGLYAGLGFERELYRYHYRRKG
ncbi:MAG: GNAT family N-acetyltransferase [Hyphomicrobiales bacterium]|nr:GNAT family N-acetyltransferase [Hyphomicrobiales bacterium]